MWVFSFHTIVVGFFLMIFFRESYVFQTLSLKPTKTPQNKENCNILNFKITTAVTFPNFLSLSRDPVPMSHKSILQYQSNSRPSIHLIAKRHLVNGRTAIFGDKSSQSISKNRFNSSCHILHILELELGCTYMHRCAKCAQRTS